jgi:hypothetical protein
MRSRIGVLCAAMALGGTAFAADPGAWSLGTGIHYSEGDYGTPTTTTILSIPVTARYDVERWSLRATIPYVEISGAGSVIPGVGSVRNTNPRGRGRGAAPAAAASEGSASGLGDVVASATYAAYYDRAAQLGLDLTGKVKIATADPDEGLGTGEHDFAALIEVYKTTDRVTLFAGLGYHILGSSAFIQLDDVFSWSLGGSYRIDTRDSAGLAYDARERVSASASPISELTAFWSRRLDRAWKAQVYVLKGFADGSPDWGAGLSATHAF